MNRIVISGRIANDLELRTTASGKHFVAFNIAVNEGSGDNQTTNFFNVNAWEANADFLIKYMEKGRKLLIEGSLKTSQYEKEGKKYTNTYILASHFDFMDSKKEEKEESKEFEAPDKVVFEDDELPF
jgi:single-strand DNA-binding protein